MPVQTLKIRHNIEVAHRLSELPGKCENIHGHSMWVVAEICGEVDSHGLLLGLEFGALKKEFRNHLDTRYDHHLLLNENDQWARPLTHEPYADRGFRLPGLEVFDGDPTTENIARWIGEWCLEDLVPYADRVHVEVWETQVNSATWEMEL
jgi:6-pyruvoyltetrahydropterin/6-carboxytetrahydropterin synthase